MNIYSRIEPTKLLHIIHRVQDVQDGRCDLVPKAEWLQVASLKQPQGTTYRPHYHIYKAVRKRKAITQECWIVIRGVIKVTYYDTDNTVLHEDVLTAGDITITLFSGHNYEWKGTGVVYEIKTGPYDGQLNDKVFI